MAQRLSAQTTLEERGLSKNNDWKYSFWVSLTKHITVFMSRSMNHSTNWFVQERNDWLAEFGIACYHSTPNFNIQRSDRNCKSSNSNSATVFMSETMNHKSTSEPITDISEERLNTMAIKKCQYRLIPKLILGTFWILTTLFRNKTRLAEFGMSYNHLTSNFTYKTWNRKK